MVKPTKPRPDFPLFVHQSGGGQWCGKVRGRFHCFGKVADDTVEVVMMQMIRATEAGAMRSMSHSTAT